jgi:hypothetical protein
VSQSTSKGSAAYALRTCEAVRNELWNLSLTDAARIEQPVVGRLVEAVSLLESAVRHLALIELNGATS